MVERTEEAVEEAFRERATAARPLNDEYASCEYIAMYMAKSRPETDRVGD